jgi:transcription elongation factor Elf1
MNETQASPITAADIVFDCPYCSKSLAIDRQGAGLLVTCPDCGQELLVPDPEATEAPATDEVGLERLDALERLRIDNRDRLEQIAAQLAIIQDSVDRIVGALQDAVEDSDRVS